MTGWSYGFDDVTKDGGVPSNTFLGLNWYGLRVTNAANYTACDGKGSNGFRYMSTSTTAGSFSATNVAYTVEVGQGGDFSNLARISAPSLQDKISVLGFWATPAWQHNLRLDVSAWDASNNQLAVRIFDKLPFGQPVYIDLRDDLRFSGIYKLTLITSGGDPVTCISGKQLVIDNLAAYLHKD